VYVVACTAGTLSGVQVQAVEAHGQRLHAVVAAGVTQQGVAQGHGVQLAVQVVVLVVAGRQRGIPDVVQAGRGVAFGDHGKVRTIGAANGVLAAIGAALVEATGVAGVVVGGLETGGPGRRYWSTVKLAKEAE
jgi:hypothetical protein